MEDEDVAGVIDVLHSGLLTQGKIVASFEKRLASFIGVNHAVAVSSGTAALHLSLLSLGVGHGSEVILPSYVCTALLNAIHYVRATPVLVDIDPDTYNISVEEAKKAISNKTSAMIIPHMFGLSADMEGILSLGVPVIEDCAQAVGATYKTKKVGSLGHTAIFSCYATKMLCAGEGGLVLSNDPRIISQIKDLRDYDEKETYIVRYNYKLTDIQAALGESQLKRLSSLIMERKEIARIYNDGLKDIAVTLPGVPDGREHVYYRYIVLLEKPAEFMREMEKRGIECRRPVFRPLHRYLNLPGYSVTEDVWSRAVSIPIYPSLPTEEAHRIVEAIKEII